MTTIYEDDDLRVVREAGPGWVSDRTEWKPGREPPPEPAAAVASLVATLGVDGVVRSAVLGADLASKAGDLWDALSAISLANTARPAIEIVTDSALVAATADVDVDTAEAP